MSISLKEKIKTTLFGYTKKDKREEMVGFVNGQELDGTSSYVQVREIDGDYAYVQKIVKVNQSGSATGRLHNPKEDKPFKTDLEAWRAMYSHTRENQVYKIPIKKINDLGKMQFDSNVSDKTERLVYLKNRDKFDKKEEKKKKKSEKLINRKNKSTTKRKEKKRCANTAIKKFKRSVKKRT